MCLSAFECVLVGHTHTFSIPFLFGSRCWMSINAAFDVTKADREHCKDDELLNISCAEMLQIKSCTDKFDWKPLNIILL